MNTKQIHSLARVAGLAPSSHNTQPWRLRVAPGHVDLVVDRSRALPVNDPAGRELVISGGCALLNLRLAVMQLGLEPVVELLPDGLDADTLARVELSSSRTSEFEAELFDAIPRRHTHRRAFQSRDVGEDIVRGLVLEAVREGAWLTVLPDARTRDAVVELVAAGDRDQWANASWRRELARWIRGRFAGDGLTAPPFTAFAARRVVRAFDLGDFVARRDAGLALRAPVLAVLGSYGDAPGDWLVTGQALQRVLLWAASRQLQAQFFNQPVQVDALRARLTELLGVAGFPQIVVALGYPSGAVRPAPRRRVEDIVRVLS